MQCLLCEKSLMSSKIINHVKYYHNFSNAALLDTFSSGQLQLLRHGGLLILGAGEDVGWLNNSVRRLKWPGVCAYQKLEVEQ